MHIRRLVLFSIVLGGCFSEGPEMVDPTSDDTTSTTDPSMTSTSTASTTTVDPVTSATTSDATGTTDPSTDMTMTTDGPTTDPTSTTEDTTEADSSSSTGEPAENVVLDFTTSPCNGVTWAGDLTNPATNNDAYPIVCPSDAESANAADGWAYPVTEETPATVEPMMVFTDDAIAMHPPEVIDGWAYGLWPALVYESGDVFRARAWCLADSICDVEIALGASIKDSGPGPAQSWNLTFADSVDIDIVLEDVGVFEGSSVGLALMVSTGGSIGSDAILWENPRIVRPDP